MRACWSSSPRKERSIFHSGYVCCCCCCCLQSIYLNSLSCLNDCTMNEGVKIPLGRRVLIDRVCDHHHIYRSCRPSSWNRVISCRSNRPIYLLAPSSNFNRNRPAFWRYRIRKPSWRMSCGISPVSRREIYSLSRITIRRTRWPCWKPNRRRRRKRSVCWRRTSRSTLLLRSATWSLLLPRRSEPVRMLAGQAPLKIPYLAWEARSIIKERWPRRSITHPSLHHRQQTHLILSSKHPRISLQQAINSRAQTKRVRNLPPPRPHLRHHHHHLLLHRYNSHDVQLPVHNHFAYHRENSSSDMRSNQWCGATIRIKRIRMLRRRRDRGLVFKGLDRR